MTIKLKRSEPVEKKFFTQTEAAAAYPMSMPTFERRVREGRGPTRARYGRMFLIAAHDLAEWLARERVGA
jgi:hypothetical protein